MPKLSMKSAWAVKMPSDTVSFKSAGKAYAYSRKRRVDDHHVQQWSPAVCQSRWTLHFKRYKKTRDQLNNQTGFGLTEEMRAQGVTLRFTVEKSYRFYYRINEVFGGQSNVEPLSHTTIPEQEDHDVDWDDEDDVSLPGNLEVSRTPDADSHPLAHNTTQEPPWLDFGLTHDKLQLLDPDFLPLPSAAEPDEPISGSAAATTTRTSRVYTDAANMRLEFSAKRLK
ncbi:unnamed protein product [Phytophthora fragariaefolia]|uniref:Unnamed protein product n=1 Tax=Phytophthora fragariaefolia TaxID=1490495 RepID=A0A9W6XVT4_9STRA|nr:unnamed protein product [Phytophthora fragariaefolia]